MSFVFVWEVRPALFFFLAAVTPYLYLIDSSPNEEQAIHQRSFSSLPSLKKEQKHARCSATARLRHCFWRYASGTRWGGGKLLVLGSSLRSLSPSETNDCESVPPQINLSHDSSSAPLRLNFQQNFLVSRDAASASYYNPGHPPSSGV